MERLLQIPQISYSNGEDIGFNGSKNFYRTLKTSALLLLCIPYEVKYFCLISSLLQAPGKPESNLRFTSTHFVEFKVVCCHVQ